MRTSTRIRPGRSRVALRGGAVVLAVLVGLAAAGRPLHAELRPSTELRFRATLSPDTLTVGDPVVLELEGSAPAGGTLLVPSFQDSIGPFDVLGTDAATEGEEEEGRTSFRLRARLTAFRTGAISAPPIPLLWIAPAGDTLVAYSDSIRATVASVLPDTLTLSDRQAALAQLRDVKGVVTLEPSRLWLWVLLGLLAAGVLYVAGRWLRRRARRGDGVAFVPAPRPVLPPEVAFRRGLERLRAEKLVEQGLFKEYYAELSLLLRRYIEGRYGIPAVEETRSEIVAAARGDRRFAAAEVEWLKTWLSAGDLVKFARVAPLAADALRSAEEAEAWVTTSTAEARARASEASSSGAMSPPAGPTPPSATKGMGEQGKEGKEGKEGEEGKEGGEGEEGRKGRAGERGEGRATAPANAGVDAAAGVAMAGEPLPPPLPSSLRKEAQP